LLNNQRNNRNYNASAYTQNS